MAKKFSKDWRLSRTACGIIAGNAQSEFCTTPDPGSISRKRNSARCRRLETDGPGREAMGERVYRVVVC